MYRRRDGSCDDRAAVQPSLKIVGQFTSRAITGLWIALQAFRTNYFQVAIQRRCEAAQFRGRPLSRLLNSLQCMLASEWRLSSSQIEQDRPQTVDISHGRKIP